jgi:hypothetical protein
MHNDNITPPWTEEKIQVMAEGIEYLMKVKSLETIQEELNRWSYSERAINIEVRSQEGTILGNSQIGFNKWIPEGSLLISQHGYISTRKSGFARRLLDRTFEALTQFSKINCVSIIHREVFAGKDIEEKLRHIYEERGYTLCPLMSLGHVEKLYP